MIFKSAVIVDDSSIARFAIKDVLKSEGYDVIGESLSVKKGVKLIDTHTPDLVVLDYKLDDGNGVDIVNRAKHIHRSKFFFVTGYLKTLKRIKMFDTGAFGISHKENMTSMKEMIRSIDRGMRYYDCLTVFKLDWVIHNANDKYLKGI